MNGHRKSDSSVVPEKTPNKTAQMAVAEEAEGRELAKGNPRQQNAPRTQCRADAHSALERVRLAAARDRKMRFTALLHQVYKLETLRAAYLSLKREAAAGVDGETWRHYGERLEDNLGALAARLQRGAYRAKPVRRVYIPKADGRQRPLGVTALEDKIVQRATVEVLNAIYETDFLSFSYGFRPGRSQHDALDALHVAVLSGQGELGARAGHPWVFRCHRPRLAGEVRRAPDCGPARGAAHPEMVERRRAGRRETDANGSRDATGWQRIAAAGERLSALRVRLVGPGMGSKAARGEVFVVRFADDIVLGFEYRSEAEQCWQELAPRLRKFGLELHPDKTRLLEFGRYAADNRQRRGQGKPETFDFLGFTHICATTRGGRFTVLRQTIRKRLQAKLGEVKTELQRRLHDPVEEVGKWLRAVVRGHVQYYGVPMNSPALASFRSQVAWLWHRTLSRRSQKRRLTWERMRRLAARWLPPPRICHPYPLRRLGVIT